MSAAENAKDATSTRNGWLLSARALTVLTFFAAGPLLIVLVYSFSCAGQISAMWNGLLSTMGGRGILYTKDIFDDTMVLADANLTILWRSIKLSMLTTLITFAVGFPTAWFIATRPPKSRALWLFLITIPFWTNLLIRTYAINEVIRNEGFQHHLAETGPDERADPHHLHRYRRIHRHGLCLSAADGAAIVRRD